NTNKTVFWDTEGVEISSQKILVVDDDQQVCDFLAEALAFLGHDVATASDGVEALQVLQQGRFSLIVADMDMPIMDGMELIKSIVQEGNTAPDIIAMTGHTMKYKYTDVVAAGAVDFIIKPFTLNELEAKVNRIIRERFMRSELERLAVRDPLTGLYNRRFFRKVVQREVVRATRYRTSLFMLYLDVDAFKEYNDEFGHGAGDDLLVRLADVLSSSIRHEVDTAFRFGGDEFTVLLTCLTGGDEATLDHALKVARRIREKYNKLNLQPTSLSIGLAAFFEKTGSLQEDIEDLVHRADRALYYVKHRLNGDNIRFDGRPED
ncbi:MAG: diguanylate cyclase, partial [Desulforhabdus sp.]|nr:diguanylate cyclase [Desulforhabdus sp.]